MANNNLLKGKRDVRRAATIKDTAEIMGVTTRQVEHVLSMDRKNPLILKVFMTLVEEKEAAYEKVKASALLEAVNALVPFNESSC